MLIPRLCTCSLVCSERQKRKAKVLITRALSLMPGSSSHRWLIHLVKNGTLLQQCLAGAAASGPAESAVDALDLLVGSDCGCHPEFLSLIWPFSAQRRDLSCTELDFLRLSVCHWENWNFESSPKRNAQVPATAWDSGLSPAVERASATGELAHSNTLPVYGARSIVSTTLIATVQICSGCNGPKK